MAPPGNSTSTAIANANSLSSSTAASPPPYAYVTFLAGNGDNVKGVVGLAKGLRKTKSKYPVVVAILPDVPEEHRKILIDQGCVVREIEPVYPPENSTQFAMAYYVINYAKLRIWEFVEYSKMIYLDGDIQVFENIDHLFDLPDGYFYAVADCCCDKTWITPQLKIVYCEHNWPAEFDHLLDLPDGYFYAVADCCCDKTWITPQLKIGYCERNCPAEFGPTKPALYFNAGMFVYNPCIETYHSLLNTLAITPTTPFAEQDFLNTFFRGIYRPIPPIYNLGLAMLLQHPDIELEKAKVVHYCAAGSKPWNIQREDIKMLIQKWSDIYNDESLDYKNYSAVVASEEAAGNEAGEDGDAGLQLFLVALSEAGEVSYISNPSAA